MPSSNDFTTPDSVEASPDSIPVVPNDNKDLERPCRFVRCQVAGVLHVITFNGNDRYMNFLPGETRFVAVTRILATGTTADGIEAMP